LNLYRDLKRKYVHRRPASGVDGKNMKDDKGLYYHPDPSDAGTRVYVRRGAADIEFRLWRADHPDVWEKHEWLAHDVVTAAAAMYRERGGGADPLRFYDLNVARALVKDEERKLAGR
jgi:hypothetical protein